jgi:GTPase SAR1 family protein
MHVVHVSYPAVYHGIDGGFTAAWPTRRLQSFKHEVMDKILQLLSNSFHKLACGGLAVQSVLQEDLACRKTPLLRTCISVLSCVLIRTQGAAMTARSTHWGQLVCGPPGSGKTSYCKAMQQFLNAAGRPTIVMNLDPANESLPYECAINIYELVALQDVMEAFKLGPNGGLMYCMEFLEKNLDWLDEALAAHPGKYVLIDCPGQAELFTHHTAVFSVAQRLLKMDYRLCAVHLVDCHHCLDPGKFIAVSLVSLMAMIRLELPHLNVLSKVDMLPHYGELPFGLDFFTDVLDMQHLAACITDESAIGHIRKRAREKHPASAAATSGFDHESLCSHSSSDDDTGKTEPKLEAAKTAQQRRRKFMEKYRRLNSKIGEVIEDYNLLAFLPISLKEPRLLFRLAKAVDKSNGFVPVGTGSGSDQIVNATLSEWEFDQLAEPNA